MVIVGAAAGCGNGIAANIGELFQRRLPFGPFYNKNLLANFCAMSLPLALAVTLEGARRARIAMQRIATQRIATQRIAARQKPKQAKWLRAALGRGCNWRCAAFLGNRGELGFGEQGWISGGAGGAAGVRAGAVARQSGAVCAAWQAHRLAFVVAAFVLVVGGGAVAAKTVVPRLLTARTSDDNSTMFRAYTWQATAQMAAARPLQGWGPGSFPTAYPQFAQTGYTRTAHQLWLQIAAENGVPALLLLLGACGAGIMAGWRALRSENWPIAAGGLGALVAFAAHGLTDAGWGMTSIVLLLLVALALLDATTADDKSRIAERDATLEPSTANPQSSIYRPSSIRWWWLGLTLLLAVVGWAHQRAVAGEEARRKAWDFAKAGAPRTALQQAREAIASDPLGVRMWLLLARIQEANGENAEASYARATQLRPVGAQAWRQWAEYRVRRTAQGSSGIASPAPLFDRAIALDLNDPGNRLARGQWRLQQGDARGWNDYEHIARLADAPYGRYPAVLEIVDLDFARAFAKLAERALQRGDKKTARDFLARGLKEVARAKGNYADSHAKASAAGMEPPEDPAPIESVLNELQA